MKKKYLGDSVYIEINERYIDSLIITTDNGYEDDPRNKIYLNSDVYTELLKYLLDYCRQKERIKE